MSFIQPTNAPSRFVFFLLSLTAGLGVQGAVATPQEPGPAPADDRDGTVSLPATVVTARKWEERAADIPMGLSVLDGETLREAGVTSVRDASFLVPNLFMNEFSSRRLSFPTMRGIGSGQGDPAVTTYIGGVPQLTTSSTNIPLVDVERIEFLRGPQSTLYGRNALGGVIHIVPRSPSGEFEADLSASIGNFASQDYRFTSSGPLGRDGLYYRFTGLSSERQGYTTNDLTGNDVDYRDSLFGRAEFFWAPDDDWDLQFAMHGESSRDGGFVLSDLAGLRSRPHHINQDFEGVAERDIFAPSVEWNYRGEDVEVTAVSAYQDWEILETSDFDFSFIDGVRRRTEESQSYFNQEIRFSPPPGEEGETPKWLAGVNLFTADSERSAANDFRPGGAGIFFPPAQVGIDTSSGGFDDWGAAVFGQTTLALMDDLDLELGVRYDHESKEASLRRTFEVGGTVVSDTRTQLSEDYDEFAPRASLGLKATEDVLIYALAASGFKAGGFNLAAPANRLAFAPETSWTGEIGAKTSWLDGLLTWNLAAFYVDWDDMQLTLFDASTGGFVDNAGSATSTGIETELRAQPVGGVEVYGSFGFTDAEFDEFTDPFGADVSGNALAFAPETTWSLGMLLSSGEDENHRLFLNVAWVGVGTYYYDAGNRESESFTLLNVRAGIERPSWRLEAFVNNALDEEYVQVAFQPNPADPTAFVGENGAPLTLGAALTFSF